jgi:poly-gamma-glutamate capsule biosynthesis protein CapA/YwtB (metallophosphatase superfamily)
MKPKQIGFLLLISFSIILAGFIMFYLLKDRLIVIGDAAKEASVPTAAGLRNPAESDIGGNAEKVQNEPKRINITAVGDILLGRGVGSRLKSQDRDYKYPFENVAELLKTGDVIFGNLEEPITDSDYSLTDIDNEGKYVLKNSLEAFQSIKYAGFNLLNLANNHILDYYEKGLEDTLKILDDSGIAHSGAGRNIDQAREPAIIEKNGLKVGMVSYTDMSEVVYKGEPTLRFMAEKDRYGVAPRTFEYIKEDIHKLRGKVDIIIVSLHWGVEESFDILPEQVEFAHGLLDSGADMIIGHHPHQFQGIEIYKGKPIFYSMGNFIFDQNDPENQESFIIKMEYEGSKLKGLNAFPVRTINKTQILPQKGEEAYSLLKREIELSTKLGSTCELKEDKIVFEIK